MSDEKSAKPEDHEKPNKYSYFVDTNKYDTELKIVSGAYIKSRIENLDPTYALWVEGRGGEKDRQVSDSDSFDLAAEKGHYRFYLVPPANFGA